jgi:hypothetical protein
MTMWRHPRGAEAEVADGIDDELASLREVATPPAMVARVMTSVAERPAPDLLSWLQQPVRIVLRVSPVSILALVSGVTLAAAMLLSQSRYPIPMSIATGGPAGMPSLAADGRGLRAAPVLVRFALRAPGARQVAVAGSFNAWRPTETILTDGGGTGLFSATVALPPGDHEYMFVVDGRLVGDPEATERRPDGYGNENAVLRL